MQHNWRSFRKRRDGNCLLYRLIKIMLTQRNNGAACKFVRWCSYAKTMPRVRLLCISCVSWENHRNTSEARWMIEIVKIKSQQDAKRANTKKKRCVCAFVQNSNLQICTSIFKQSYFLLHNYSLFSVSVFSLALYFSHHFTPRFTLLCYC